MATGFRERPQPSSDDRSGSSTVTGPRRDRGAAAVAATVLTLPDGRRLAYGEYGDPTGDPVVGLHGTPGGRYQLSVLADDAAAAGVRLIVPDRPGYGYSELAPRRRLTDWPADVEAIADHLGLGRFAVLGVSGGGPHALACAAALGSRVRATGVVSGVAPFTWDDVTAELKPAARPLVDLITRTFLLRVLIAIGLWLLRTFPSVVIGAYRRWLPAADVAVLNRPGLLDHFVDETRRMAPTAARAVVQDLRLFTSAWQIDLALIRTPVHVWHGEADKTVPVAHGRQLARAVPDGTFHLCPGEGHLCLVPRARWILSTLTAAGRGSMTGRDRRPGTGSGTSDTGTT